jgi:DNA invertase Pin-like site-specific DNA recombinase
MTVNRTRSARPTSPKVIRVAIYVRQSLDANDDRAAVQRQLETCNRWCAERSTPEVSYTVIRVFEDNDTSATKVRRGRKGFTEMLTDAKAGQFDLIVAYHLDRLTRTIRDLLPLLDLATVDKVGTTTVSGELDLTTDMGRLVAGILAVVAQAEVDRKAARQILANQQRADLGDPHIGGARPVGYDRVQRGKGEEHLPKLVLREDEATPIRQAYRDLLAGRSCSAIARDLNAAGVRTTKLNTRRAGLFTHGAVKTLLANPLYGGKKVYRGEVVRDGNWVALVDESMWRSACALLTDPARRTNTSQGGTRRWLGTGLYRCGVCSANGVTQTLVSNYRADGVRAYLCRGGKHLSRTADSIDEHVVSELCERLSREDAHELLEDRDRPDLAALHDQESKLIGRIEKVTDEFTDDPDVSEAQLRRITRKLNAQLADVQAKMVHTDRAALLADLVNAPDPRVVWDTMPLDRQRAVLAALMDVVVLRGRAGGNSHNGPRPLDTKTIRVRCLA